MVDTGVGAENAKAGGIVKKRSKGRNPEYGSYLLKMSKKINPECDVNKLSMWVLNGITEDLLTRMITKSNEMAALEGKSTLKAKHAQAATHALFSGELARHSISAGTKAVSKYTAYTPVK